MFEFFEENFLDDALLFEAVQPGSVFGEVDLVCVECGETSTIKANDDGSNQYTCPHCGALNEV